MGDIIAIARYSQGKRRRKLFNTYNWVEKHLSICEDIMSNMDKFIQAEEEKEGIATSIRENMSKMEREVLIERFFCIEDNMKSIKRRLLGIKPLRK